MWHPRCEHDTAFVLYPRTKCHQDLVNVKFAAKYKKRAHAGHLFDETTRSEIKCRQVWKFYGATWPTAAAALHLKASAYALLIITKHYFQSVKGNLRLLIKHNSMGYENWKSLKPAFLRYFQRIYILNFHKFISIFVKSVFSVGTFVLVLDCFLHSTEYSWIISIQHLE